MIEKSDVTGIVLCGGRGSRLGGHDKPLIEIGAGRMIDLICNRLANQVGSLLISCSRNVALYESLGHDVVVDDEDERGPLAGLYAAFKRVESNWALTVPGDTPFIPLNLVDRLTKQALQYGVAVPVSDGERQNLCLLIDAEHRKLLSAYHESGGSAVKYWLDDLNCGTTNLEDLDDQFLNVNTPDDLSIAEARSESIRHESAPPIPD